MITKQMVWLLLLVAVVAILVAVLKRPRSRKAAGDFKARKLLTEREQAMYFRLRQACPDEVVLSQVAFSALITAKDLATRATFNRKVADFVLVNKAFEVVAVIELDDFSHKGRKAQDGKRDQLLKLAGYRVLRFDNVPDVDVVLDLLARPTAP